MGGGNRLVSICQRTRYNDIELKLPGATRPANWTVAAGPEQSLRPPILLTTCSGAIFAACIARVAPDIRRGTGPTTDSEGFRAFRVCSEGRACCRLSALWYSPVPTRCRSLIGIWKAFAVPLVPPALDI